MKKVVARGRWWSCENLDLLAPISQHGTALLFSDGTSEYYNDGQEIPEYEKATNDEVKSLAHERGFYFVGDFVEIVRGKLKGMQKQVTGNFRYTVPNTYGKAYTDYLTFSDGTKTNILNCQINGVRVIKEFSGFSVGGRI